MMPNSVEAPVHEPAEPSGVGKPISRKCRCVFEDGAAGVRLHQGDCLELMDSMADHPDGRFDLGSVDIHASASQTAAMQIVAA